MTGLDIQPFGDEHLDAAAELLAERHARHREAEPLLPGGVDFRGQIESEWRNEGASGVFASRNGEPVGYLVGFPNRFGLRVGIGGHAVRSDAEVAEPAFDASVVIRPGTPEDVEAAALLDRELGVSMQPAPSFSYVNIESAEEYVSEWQGTWDDPQFTHFVAERDGRVVGHSLLYKRPADLRVPEDSIDLANAATFPHSRGSGVGRALFAHVITWAHEHGYPAMVTDWRMTNLLASRFWPKRGFRPTFVRLYRNLS